jgi:hypothetical protein
MVDSRLRPGGVLAGAWLTGAAEPGSSLWVGEKGEELRGVLTEGFGGRFDGEARPAAVKLGEGRLGARRVGNGGGGECGEEGQAPRPFIGSEGGAGRLNGGGDRAAGGGGINAGRPVRWGGEMEGRVGSEEGGSATPFLGGEGTLGRCARASGGTGGCAVGFPRRKKLGGAHAEVRGEGGGSRAGRKPRPGGEGGRWLGLGEGGGPREEEGDWAGGRSHGPGGKGRRPGRNRCSG